MFGHISGVRMPRPYRDGMPPAQAALVVAALVALTVLSGIVMRACSGRVTRSRAPADLGARVDLGDRATLVQFSTPFCAACGPTRTALRKVADDFEGVVHIDIDLTERPELAHTFSIVQTPTTLLLDRVGAVRARVGGAPRPGVVREELGRLLAI